MVLGLSRRNPGIHDCVPDVVSPALLVKITTRTEEQAGLLQDLHTVEGVWFHSQVLKLAKMTLK